MGLDLTAKLGMNSAGFDAGLKEAEKKVETAAKTFSGSFESALGGNFVSNLFAKSFGAVGAGAIATLAESLASKLQEEFKQIQIGSQLTNLDTQTFQRVRNIVEATGGSAEQLATSMQHVATAIEHVKDGGEAGEKAGRALLTLGASLEDIRNENYQKVFFQIAESLKDAELTAEKMNALREVLGRGGVALLPAFRKGFDNELAVRGTISDEDLKKLKEIKEIAASGAGFWREWANQIGLFFAKAKAGLVGFPRIFTGPDRESINAKAFEEAHAGQRQELDAKEAERQRQQFEAQLQAQDEAAQSAKAEEARQKKIPQLLDEAMAAEQKLKETGLNRSDRIELLKTQLETLRAGIAAEHGQFEHSGSSTARLSELTLRKEAAEKEMALRELLKKPDKEQFTNDLAKAGAANPYGRNDAIELGRDIARNVEQVLRTLERIDRDFAL
jgi:hypothetical protein